MLLRQCCTLETCVTAHVRSRKQYAEKPVRRHFRDVLAHLHRRVVCDGMLYDRRHRFLDLNAPLYQLRNQISHGATWSTIYMCH